MRGERKEARKLYDQPLTKDIILYLSLITMNLSMGDMKSVFLPPNQFAFPKL
jgi:hypothetical protein